VRIANPNAGVQWAQSNDYWMNFGFSAARDRVWIERSTPMEPM
jgi:hypothetical protein